MVWRVPRCTPVAPVVRPKDQLASRICSSKVAIDIGSLRATSRPLGIQGAECDDGRQQGHATVARFLSGTRGVLATVGCGTPIPTDRRIPRRVWPCGAH